MTLNGSNVDEYNPSSIGFRHVRPCVVQHMLCELCGALEGLVALHADKNPPGARLLLVKLQRGEVAKVLAASRASVGFLFAVDVLVTHEAGGHGERHAALGALVGPRSGVDGLVLSQVGRLGETLGAHRADVRPNAGVALLVLGHAAGQSEGFAAVGAGEGPLPQVLPLVALQGEGLVESLVAVRAREGLVVGVHVPLVLPQVGGANEILAAGVAHVGLFAGVCADVLAVVGGPDVGLDAEGAVIRPLARVETLVLLQRALVGVRLAANVARVRLEARVRLQVTLQVAELLEGPAAVGALEGTVLFVDDVAFLHCDQKSGDLVIAAFCE